MNRFTQPVCTCLLVLLTGTVTAGQIYRSVDAEGNVTFSSEPPENATSVEEVDIPPGPSAEEQHEARERMQRQEATAGEMGEARANRAQQRSGSGCRTDRCSCRHARFRASQRGWRAMALRHVACTVQGTPQYVVQSPRRP
jgi:hypothetical protein